MRSSDENGVRAGAPEPAGGHARRRLDEEITSRFGAVPDAEPSVESVGDSDNVDTTGFEPDQPDQGNP